ncbi:hypothetical protein EVG20_g3590 [Dentipellis fragilis]|uniref:Tethering factor for nuclear proteasome STS1 n=1 Tax=Dentipellis fragilis TaxID=205917 RepID=A0A4Y9Z2V6_9AGAM|nr:hypothetical protein EVG20_g3590 [Dentipellis fragilis]
MANLIQPQPQLDFHSHPVTHAPSPFGFGFGLSSMARPASAAHSAFAHPVAFQQLASTISQSARPQKRRIEHDDDQDSGMSRHGSRDDAMDRSPTPERPRRAVPKRARTTPATMATGSKDSDSSKENKDEKAGDQDVDVGVLLASLPPQSLLPLLNSLLQAQPSLKPLILSLIPRPSLETAIQALAQSAKKLRDAYPYSNTPSFSQSASPAPFGGFGFASTTFNNRPSGFGFGNSSMGFGRPSPTLHSSGFNTPSGSDSNSGGMREEYIVSRIRPHINDFVSACLSYLPYFSDIPASTSTPSSANTQSTSSLQKDKPQPPETFMFLSALTSHILAQPPLTQASLVPTILPRLLDEWKAWIDRVDEIVNRQGGMFGGETVRGWERSLDEFAEAKGHGTEALAGGEGSVGGQGGLVGWTHGPAYDGGLDSLGVVSSMMWCGLVL